MSTVLRGSDNFDTAGGNAVKAWVNFNGTGTVAIRASWNVTSITDNGTGNYTVNFTTALSDANYAAVATAKPADNTTLPSNATVAQTISYSTSSVLVLANDAGTARDCERVSVAILR